MSDVLFTVHQTLGYVVSVLVLVGAMVAFGRAKNAQEFTPGLYRGIYGLLIVQILLGATYYGIEGYWEAAPLLAYVHPVLGLLAIGAGQATLGRARRTQMAVDAHRLAGRGLVVTLVLVAAAVGVASAA